MPDIQVTNHNSFPLQGRFAGIDYTFPPGEAVTVPEKAAEHIFALGEEKEQKTGALNRLRLLKPGDTLEEAYKALDNISFAEGRTVFEESEPLPPPTGIGDTPGAPRNPGGESAAETSSSVSVAAALARETPDEIAREVMAARRKRGGG